MIFFSFQLTVCLQIVPGLRLNITASDCRNGQLEMPYTRGSDWQRQQSCEGLRKSDELEEKGKHFVFIQIVC
jgi:hypothetical protein